MADNLTNAAAVCRYNTSVIYVPPPINPLDDNGNEAAITDHPTLQTGYIILIAAASIAVFILLVVAIVKRGLVASRRAGPPKGACFGGNKIEVKMIKPSHHRITLWILNAGGAIVVYAATIGAAAASSGAGPAASVTAASPLATAPTTATPPTTRTATVSATTAATTTATTTPPASTI